MRSSVNSGIVNSIFRHLGEHLWEVYLHKCTPIWSGAMRNFSDCFTCFTLYSGNTERERGKCWFMPIQLLNKFYTIVAPFLVFQNANFSFLWLCGIKKDVSQVNVYDSLIVNANYDIKTYNLNWKMHNLIWTWRILHFGIDVDERAVYWDSGKISIDPWKSHWIAWVFFLAI